MVSDVDRNRIQSIITFKIANSKENLYVMQHKVEKLIIHSHMCKLYWFISWHKSWFHGIFVENEKRDVATV